MSYMDSVTLSGVGSSRIIWFKQPPSTLSAPPPFQAGLICTVSAGASLTYTVQVTADPPFQPTAVNWNDHDVLAALTASKSSNILYPVTGLLLKVTSWASGSVNLGVAQWP